MLTAASPNKRSRPHDGDASSQTIIDGGVQATKRRAFLQTMGQQLREFGADDTSPRNATPGRSHAASLESGTITAEKDQGQIQTPESDVVPGENDQLPSGATKSASKYLWTPDEVSLNAANETPRYSFDDLLEWSKSYFDNWHPAYPFVHAPSLLSYFRRIAQSGILDSEPTAAFHLTILRSVLSISLADRRQTSTNTQRIPAELVFNSFNHALNSIQWVLTEESSILALQAVISVQLFLISMLRFNAAARLEGLAIRMAVQLGLHRCPAKLSPVFEKDAEVRKRLFWALYCIDRYTCIRLGIPLAIRDDDIDVCLPSSEQHSEQGSEPLEYDHRLSVLEFLAKHAQIRGSVMDLRKKPATSKKSSADEQAVEANAKLTRWWNEVDDYLESNDERPVPISRFHQVTLSVLRYESTIALNRSVLATSEKTPAYDAALQNCIAASKSVINILHSTLNDSRGPEVSEHTPLLWPSFTWAVWMSAFVILFAANEEQVPYETASRLANRSLKVLDHLAKRGTMWPDACAVAIRNLLSRLTEHGRTSQRSTRDIQNKGTPLVERNIVPSSDANNTLNTQSTPPTRQPRSRQTQQPLQFPASPASQLNYSFTVTRHDSNFSRDMHPPEHSHRSISYDSAPRLRSSMESASLSDFPIQNMSFSDLPGSFLGIAQQLSDNPISNDEITDLFLSSDVPLWMGDDQYQIFGGSL